MGAAPDGLDAPPHGAELRAGRWELPVRITADMCAEAHRWLQQHRERSGFVQSGVLQQWLAIVISGSARRPGDDIDEAARLRALMFAVEEHPAYCFTKTTLRQAQRRFKFLPTPAELLEFCDAIAGAEKQTADRLGRIVEKGPHDAVPPEKRPWAHGGALDQADYLRRKADRERAELVEIIRKRDAAAAIGETPRRMHGESDRDYVRRLVDHAKGHLAAGEKALKRDAARHRAGLPSAEALDVARSKLTRTPEPAESPEPEPVP